MDTARSADVSCNFAKLVVDLLRFHCVKTLVSVSSNVLEQLWGWGGSLIGMRAPEIGFSASTVKACWASLVAWSSLTVPHIPECAEEQKLTLNIIFFLLRLCLPKLAFTWVIPQSARFRTSPQLMPYCSSCEERFCFTALRFNNSLCKNGSPGMACCTIRALLQALIIFPRCDRALPATSHRVCRLNVQISL